MKHINLYNCTMIKISSASIHTSLEKCFQEEGIKIACIEDPYVFFDRILKEWADSNISYLFSKDIKQNIVKMESEEFLIWLDTLNIMPLYNPQIFQFDIRKRINHAVKNLEKFDYIVPTNEVGMFLKEVYPEVSFVEKAENNPYFRTEVYHKTKIIKKFLEKDILLYQNAKNFWKDIKKHQYASLKTFINLSEEPSLVLLTGIIDDLSSRKIAGWVVLEGSKESLTVEIYRNRKKIYELKADKMRPGVKKSGLHPTGRCGFYKEFEKDVFTPYDLIEVRTIPTGYVLPQGKKVKEFLVDL